MNYNIHKLKLIPFTPKIYLIFVCSWVSIVTSKAQNVTTFNYDVAQNQISANFTGGQNCGPLPVALVSFSAKSEKLTTQLNWLTAHEVDSQDFQIQHSATGKDWKVIGNVPASGQSSKQKQYSYIHSSPVNGNNYYRLKSIDLDGSFSYSQICVVNFDLPDFLYPNPAKDWIFLADVRHKISSYTLNDASGKLIDEGLYDVEKGISAKNLQNGLYVLSIHLANKSNRMYRVIIEK